MGSGYKVEKGVQWARLEPYQRALIAFLSGIKNEAWIRQRDPRYQRAGAAFPGSRIGRTMVTSADIE